MIFRTERSTYELDAEGKRIRRLRGERPPTERQGPDGVWRVYEDVTEIREGRGVVFIWRYDLDKDGSIIARTTVTSCVLSMDDS